MWRVPAGFPYHPFAHFVPHPSHNKCEREEEMNRDAELLFESESEIEREGERACGVCADGTRRGYYGRLLMPSSWYRGLGWRRRRGCSKGKGMSTTKAVSGSPRAATNDGPDVWGFYASRCFFLYPVIFQYSLKRKKTFFTLRFNFTDSKFMH